MKSTGNVGTAQLAGLGSFADEYPEVRRRILVCMEPKRRRLESGIEVMPVTVFLRELWAGRIA